MLNKLDSLERTYVFIGLVAVGLFAVIVAISIANSHGKLIPDQGTAQRLAQNDTKSGPYRYLPEGAKINNKDKDVVLVDLGGDGGQEEIIFFSLPQEHKVGIVVLKSAGADYTRLWEEVYEHSASFSDPSGVYDLNKTGRPQIVAYRTIGTSCPGALEIYEYHNGKIERISGPWAGSGHCESVEIKDLNADGRPEIIIRTRSYGANPDVYTWNGKQYVKNNSEFFQYYNDELSDLIRDVYSLDALPTNARVRPCKQAVQIYLFQHRYAEAIALCSDILRIIDDPKLTKPNVIMKEGYTTEQLNSIAAWFEIDKAEAKATIHHLRGDTYKVAGNSPQAQAEYREEQELQSKAKEMKSKLPPIKLVPVN